MHQCLPSARENCPTYSNPDALSRSILDPFYCLLPVPPPALALASTVSRLSSLENCLWAPGVTLSCEQKSSTFPGIYRLHPHPHLHPFSWWSSPALGQGHSHPRVPCGIRLGLSLVGLCLQPQPCVASSPSVTCSSQFCNGLSWAHILHPNPYLRVCLYET